MPGLGVLLLLVFVSSFPAIAVYCWFRVARYPFSLLRFSAALIAGAAAFFLALVLKYIIPDETAAWLAGKWTLLTAKFIRGAFEELSRLLVLLVFFAIADKFATKKTDAGDSVVSPGSAAPLSYNAVMQGAAAGLVAGIGFAILETAALAVSTPHVVPIRDVIPAAIHAACGYRVGSAAMLLREHPAQAVFRFFSAVAIHGIYNFMVIIPGVSFIAAMLIALSALASSIMSIHGGMKPIPDEG